MGEQQTNPVTVGPWVCYNRGQFMRVPRLPAGMRRMAHKPVTLVRQLLPVEHNASGLS